MLLTKIATGRIKVYTIIGGLLIYGVAAAALGYKIASPPEIVVTMKPQEMMKLQALAKEQGATIAHMQSNPETVIKYLPAEIREDAEALAEVVDAEPTTRVGFDVAAVEGTAEGPEGLPYDNAEATGECPEICAPQEFTFSGVLQELKGAWTLNSRLYHSHGEDLVWSTKMGGDASVYVEGFSRTKWFGGLMASFDEDLEPSAEFIGGRTFTHFGLVGTFNRAEKRSAVGVFFRWGER